jgi:hypothetical protein
MDSSIKGFKIMKDTLIVNYHQECSNDDNENNESIAVDNTKLKKLLEDALLKNNNIKKLIISSPKKQHTLLSFREMDFSKFDDFSIVIKGNHNPDLPFEESTPDNINKNFIDSKIDLKFVKCKFKNINLGGNDINFGIYNIEFNNCDFENLEIDPTQKNIIKIEDNINKKSNKTFKIKKTFKNSLDDSIIQFILKNVNIVDSKIEEKIKIINSTNTKISNTKFIKETIIENSSVEVEFEGVRFFQELRINNYSSIKIKNSRIRKLDLSEGIKYFFAEKCRIFQFTIGGEIYNGAIFKEIKFIIPPKIYNVNFKNCNVEFSDVKFEDTSSPQEAIAGFRALNKACRDANYHHGEILFHGLTLEGIGKNLKYKSDFVEKLFSFFINYLAILVEI